jgi:hypothetical protein
LADKSIVSVFGAPLFATERVDDAPDVLSPPLEKSSDGASGSDSKKSGGFFSSVVDTLNPFSSKKP